MNRSSKEIVDRVQDWATSHDEDVPSVQTNPVVCHGTETVSYRVSQHVIDALSDKGAMVDRGANGGIAGEDVRAFNIYDRRVDITGIGNHQLKGLPMCDAAAKIMTSRGPAIAIMMQYALRGKGKTIHSSGQVEHYKNIVHDRSLKVGGKQCIVTQDGYVLPLDIVNGLPYIRMQKHTDEEWKELPHVVLTSPHKWNPRVLDNYLSKQTNWKELLSYLDEGLIKTPFDEFGEYLKRQPTESGEISEESEDEPDENNIFDDESQSEEQSDDEDDDSLDDTSVDYHESLESRCADFSKAYKIASDYDNASFYPSCFESDTVATAMETDIESESDRSSSDEDSDDGSSTSGDDESTLSGGSDDTDELIADEPDDPGRKHSVVPFDYEKYRPYFLFVPREKARKTWENTTQFAANVVSGIHVMKTIKSPYPALNVWRRYEPVATDTIEAGTEAICTNGQKYAQIFIGRKSRVIDVYGMATSAEFVNTLEDVIRKRGAMDKLISDSARVEISRRVQDILRALFIDSWQSEAYFQWQNFAEHGWKFLKHNVQFIMNWRNVMPGAWLLCMQWVADVMNHTSEKSLKWRPPLEVLTGQTIDISILLCFLFWDVCYVSRYKGRDYSDRVGEQKSSEIRAWFVGFAWDVGHAMTFKFLTCDTLQIIKRSRARLAKVGENNLKLDVAAGAVPERIYIHSKRKDDDRLPTIDVTTNPYSIMRMTENGEPVIESH